MRRILCVASVTLVAASLLAPIAGAANAAPEIVSAAMLDAVGHDDRADQIVLTYSEKIWHRNDGDGNYPFTVGGYEITSIGRARKSSTLTIFLAEHDVPDVSATPAITFFHTRRDHVHDRRGKQAEEQTFTSTIPLDRDGDGSAADDCAPDDPSVGPLVADQPDMTFKDSNCDGIDGNVGSAIFVAPDGDDENNGSKDAPKRTMNAALVAADAVNKDVYAAGGTYDEGTGAELASGVGIYGGYDPSTWARAADTVTKVVGSAQAAIAEDDQGVVLQLLTFSSTGSTEPGASSYGIRATNSSISMRDVLVTAGDGADGVTGGSGTDGMDGGDGDRGASGSDTSIGGAGGTVATGRDGGKGGDGGVLFADGQKGSDGAQGGGAGGNGGAQAPSCFEIGGSGAQGEDVAAASNGVSGPGGAGGTASSSGWTSAPGSDGTDGADGVAGGGGGGGGSGGGCFSGPQPGGGGGGGGAGGVAGSKGGAGTGGGGSFALYLFDSTVDAKDSTFVSGAAGDGGSGGVGGIGGDGGEGGVGGAGEGLGGAGGRGGNGSKGGNGGHGGGGAGGPSFAVYRAGSSSFTAATNELTHGAFGIGGGAAAGGHAGQNGSNGDLF